MPGKTSNIRWKVGRDFPGRNDLLATSPHCLVNNFLRAGRRHGRGSYWFCNKANGTYGGISTDLVARQNVGIGGGLIMDVIGVQAESCLS